MCTIHWMWIWEEMCTIGSYKSKRAGSAIPSGHASGILWLPFSFPCGLAHEGELTYLPQHCLLDGWLFSSVAIDTFSWWFIYQSGGSQSLEPIHTKRDSQQGWAAPRLEHGDQTTVWLPTGDQCSCPLAFPLSHVKSSPPLLIQFAPFLISLIQ